jgi:hypothetical protein
MNAGFPSTSGSGITTPPIDDAGRLSRPWVLSIVAATVGIVAGIGLGYVTGWSIESSTSCSPNDGWCDLGAAVTGVFVGTLVGVIAYVAAGVIVIFRARPKHHRSHPIIIHVLLPIAAVAILIAIGVLLSV